MLNEQLPSYLNALSLCCGEVTLLLPNTAVAELLAKHSIEAVDSAPKWLAGLLDWRGLRLPVVAFEALNGESEPHSSNTRVVVLNAVSGQKELRFFAMRVHGIPRPLRVDKSLASQSQASLGEYEQAVVMVDGKSMVIPDLSKLEKLLANSGIV